MSAPQIQYPPTSGGGAPVGGTGTTNYIPRWTGASTLGDSIISESQSAGATFHAFTLQNTQAQAAREYFDVYAVYSGALNTVMSRIEMGRDNATPGNYASMIAFSTRVNGGSLLERMRIDPAGNVGIGTASPGAQLQVERAGGLSNAEYLRLRNTTSGNGSAVAQDYYVHANTVATGRIQHTWNGTTYDTTLSVWNNSLSSLQEAVRVQGGGNVGIGTASPGAILHTLGTGTTTGIFATSSANSWIELRRSTSTTLGYIGTGSLVTGGAAADLAFRCESGNLLFSTVATERARIDSTGNLLMAGNGTAANPIIANSTGVSGMYFPSATTVAIAANGAIAATFSKVAGAGVALGGTTGLVFDASGSQQGIKLRATPDSTDTQTLDCYQETTLNSGFTTSGITSTGTFTVTARATRIGRSIALTIRIAPSGGASLTFASGWNITLTGMPQMPIEGPLAATSSDATVGRNSVQVSQDATPIIYGGTTGAYALGANVSLNVSGIIT